jgi:hypothetical protein
VAEVDENFADAYVPDVLALSLDLPLEDALDAEGAGVEEDGADGTHGLGAEAVGDAQAEVMRIVGEENVVCVEVGECGFEAEDGSIAELVGGVSEGTGGEREGGFGWVEIDVCGYKRTGSGADAGLIDLGHGHWRGLRGRSRCGPGCGGRYVGGKGGLGRARSENGFWSASRNAAGNEDELGCLFEADVVFGGGENGGSLGAGADAEGEVLCSDDLTSGDD